MVQAAGRAALMHPAVESAMRLEREILEVERVHGALKADVQLGELALTVAYGTMLRNRIS